MLFPTRRGSITIFTSRQTTNTSHICATVQCVRKEHPHSSHHPEHFQNASLLLCSPPHADARQVEYIHGGNSIAALRVGIRLDPLSEMDRD